MKDYCSDQAIFIKDIDSIPLNKANHVGGRKRVIINKDQTLSNLTQLAKGHLAANESVETHIHPTMEEFFYITEGDALFKIDNRLLYVSQNDIIRVPANSTHSIEATSDLEFLYWGISI